ncbi:GNAT family N-acetyltransferase [Candidatus Dojkabacteria bacterium]|nr:GNAT family N-acetyltransferase [Candidatus Dojkabacteria bacterium]
MVLSLSDIRANPEILTFKIRLNSKEKLTLRPLEKDDCELLNRFLEGLSEQTREFYIYPSYDFSMAKELCDAINRYDKLRFVLNIHPKEEIIALFEYSFDIPESDRNRFKKYEINLSLDRDCRLGPCISDVFQNRGIGSAIFPYLIEIAKRFQQKRIILWGGVFKENKLAITFYENNGFEHLGEFVNSENKVCLDMIYKIFN